MECHWALGMAHYFPVWTAERKVLQLAHYLAMAHYFAVWTAEWKVLQMAHSLLGNDVVAPEGIADGMPLDSRDGSLLDCVDG